MPRFFVIALFFLILAFQSPLYAQVSYAPILPAKGFIPESEAFDALRLAYSQVDYEHAIREAKRLKRQDSDKTVAEQATFILGELYLAMAEKGRPLQYTKAVQAFRDARTRYPDSEQAVSALWKTGEIYIRRRLFYEAIASFNRILKKYPESAFIIRSQLGKAKTYLSWKKWKKAMKEMDLVDPLRLSAKERSMLLLGYANAYHHLGELAAAYRYYKLVSPKNKTLQQSPENLLHYGRAAFEAKDYERARKVLSILYTQNERAPEAPLALARIGDTWRLERFEQQAQKFYESVRKIKASRPGLENALLIAAVGELHIAGCFPRPLLTSVSDCKARNVLNRLDGQQALKKIKLRAEAILNLEQKPADLRGSLLLEAIVAMEQHGAHATALEVEEMILKHKRKIPFKFKKIVKKIIKKTALKTATQFIKNDNDPKLIDLYFRHQKVFNPEKIQEDIGFQIGLSLHQAGMYEAAIPLFLFVAQKRKGKYHWEARYYLANAHFLLRNNDDAEREIALYIQEQPKNPHTPFLQVRSTQIAARKEDQAKVIKKARHWLKQYPKHKRRKTMLHLLASAQKEKGALKEAISSYLKIEPRKKRNPGLTLEIADLYYRLKAYKKAIPFYHEALKKLVDQEDARKEGEQAEWARFQLAKSYEALGQEEKGRPFFAQLAKASEDRLIKRFSSEKTKAALAP